MYLIYPEGNWIEVGSGTPYVIIGESRYGKPILDRVWAHEDSLAQALKVGLLAFDATRTSASDVDYPVDVVSYIPGTFAMREQRFSGLDLQPLRDYWQNAIRAAVTLADPVMEPLVWRLEQAVPARTHYGDSGTR
jgi:putative proteasome-type protease